MTNRIAATYAGGVSTATHTITFTAPTAGSRLILVVSSYYDVATPSGWIKDLGPSAFNFGFIYSKIAAGTETSVSLALGGPESRVHAVLYERDDCPTVLYSGTASGSFVTDLSTIVTVPADASGRAFAVVNSPAGPSGGALTWNQGLGQDYAPGAASSSSFFASGPLPASGSRTYTASGITVSGLESSLLGVVGYGSTDASPPSTPANLHTTATSYSGIDVAWDASTDNIGVAGYGIYVNGVKQGADQAGLTRSFSGLTPGAAYTIEVDAADSSGNRSAKAQLVVSTPADTTPPTVPGTLHTTSVTPYTAGVAWDASTDDYALAGYGVYVNGVKQGGDQADLTRAFSGLTPGAAYTIEVDAADSSGNRSAKASVAFTTPIDALPSIPPGFTATPDRDTVSLAWEASTDDLGISRYEVLLDGVVVATTTELAWILDSLTRGATYLVGVRAVDVEEGRSSPAALQVAVPAPAWTAIETPVYEIGDWAGNVRDEFGVDWIVEREEGWSSSPPVTTLTAEADATDGAFSGPGRYGSRLIILEGVAIAPNRMEMLAAQERIGAVVHPRVAARLRVTEAHMARQAWIRLADEIDITDAGAKAFRWTLTVLAADPRRYAVQPLYATASAAAMPGSAQVTITLAGDYPTIPGVLRVYGPITDFTITHLQSGQTIVTKAGTTLPADQLYSVEIDLHTRLVWAYVPPEVDPERRQGRSLLAKFPPRFSLAPGPNTFVLAGSAAGAGRPRIVATARDAWI